MRGTDQRGRPSGRVATVGEILGTPRENSNAAPGVSRVIAVWAVFSLIVLSLLVFRVDGVGAHTPHDVISDIVVSPNFAEDGTVFTISRTLVLKSTDGGSTWSKLSAGLDVKGPAVSLGISSQDPETVYVAGWGSGVFRSRDGGSTWSNVNGNLGRRSVTSLAVSPWTHDLVFGTGPSGSPVWVSSTGGRTWREIDQLQSVTTIAFAEDVDGLVVIGDELGAVHASRDRGATWSTLPFQADDDGGIRSITVSPRFSSDRTFFVGTESAGVYRTTDGGSSFTRSDAGLADSATISLAISPSFAADRTLWASTFTDGVYVSEDRGESWTSSSDGLTKNEQADLLNRSHFEDLRVAVTSGGRPALFLGAFNGLFLSRDGGRSWEEMETQPASTIMGIAVSPAYAEDGTLFLTTYVNGLFRSRDGGTTWVPTNSGVASRFEWTRSRFYVSRLFPATFSPNYAVDKTVFAATRGYIFRSTDRGSHWDAIIPEGAIVEGEVPPDYFFVGVSPDYANDATILVGTDGGKIFISKDGGESYERLADLGREVTSLVMSPEFADDSTAFVGTPEGVFRTEDRGESWVSAAWPWQAGAETSLAISPDYGSDRTLFAGSVYGLYKTADGGGSWSHVPGPDAVAVGYIEGVAVSPEFGADGTVLVSAKGRGLYRSTDRGATWEPIGENLLADNVVFSNFYHSTAEPIVFSSDYADDRTVFGFDGTRLFRSTNGGGSWREIDRPVTEHDTSEASAPGPLRSTPLFGQVVGPSTGDGHTDHRQVVTAVDGQELTARKIALAASGAVLGLVILWLAERVRGRWRWVILIATPIAVFGGLLWLLMRR